MATAGSKDSLGIYIQAANQYLNLRLTKLHNNITSIPLCPADAVLGVLAAHTLTPGLRLLAES